uniref:Sarcosine oxidase delta subunit heterotetrameric n=1 Tax=Caulobacter sp. (strain K31) TaxID=366602 RepID=B0SV23_CAUSK
MPNRTFTEAGQNMRIDCPYCGPRDSGEFVYRGDAKPRRPDASDAEAFVDYVYLRENVAGSMDEHWYHLNGCRQWLTVRRDTLSHEIQSSRLSQERGS